MKKIILVLTMVLTLILTINITVSAKGETELSLDTTPILIDVISDYSSLPESVDSYEEITSYELYDEITNSYHMEFNNFESTINEEITYKFDVALPEDVNLDNYVKGTGAINVTYTTLASGDRVLYLQSDLTQSPYPLEVDIEAGFNEEDYNALTSFIVVNMTQQETQKFKLLVMNSIINKEDYYNAFMYCFYDITIEDILVMSVEYDYRYKFFGIPGEWNTDYKTFYKNTTYEMECPWWYMFVIPFEDMITTTSMVELDDIVQDGGTVNPIDNTEDGDYVVETISTILKADIPENVLEKYYTDFNAVESDLDALNLYKIHIGQFIYDGFITGLNTGYDISEYSVTKLLYKYDGIIYEATERQLDVQENIVPGESFNFLEIPSLGIVINKAYFYMGVAASLLTVLGIYYISRKVRGKKIIVSSKK